MPRVPFKLNQDRRRHIPRQKRKVTNWREYDAGLRQRGSLIVWFTADAVQAWQAAAETDGAASWIGWRSVAEQRVREGDLNGAREAYREAP